jgi:hypothetical protein
MLKSNKMNRWSGTKTCVFPPKRDADNISPEEDEIELWDGWQSQRGQRRRASAHVQGDSTRVVGSLLAGNENEESKITVHHEITVQYGRGEED